VFVGLSMPSAAIAGGIGASSRRLASLGDATMPRPAAAEIGLPTTGLCLPKKDR